MKSISMRIAELEKRAKAIVASSGNADRLSKELEIIASRLEWDAVSPAWAGKQSPVTIIAVVLHGPLPAIEAVFPKLVEISEGEGPAGRLAKTLLEKVQ